MNIITKESGNITIIELEGNVLGGPDASALNDTLHQLTGKKKKNIIVDLSGVQSMNSSGLTMLIGALTTIRNAGGEMKIAAPSKKIESILVITKLATVFEIHPTVRKAISSFT
jgi:anti-sigma B factor antagonist